jgi:hypothetical protein
VVDTIDRIWKNMGMDQNLLSQLHTFKVSGFDRCPKPKSPGGLKFGPQCNYKIARFELSTVNFGWW